MKLTNNELLRQFEYECGDDVLVAEYSFQERKIFLTKLITDKCQDKEKVDEFLKEIMNIAEENRWRVVPINSDVVSFFKKNPAYKDVLAIGLRI